MTSAKHIKVLVVEDSAVDEELVILELERAGYEVEHERVDTEGAMKAALERSSWDIVLSDHSMPKFSGPRALALLRNAGLDTPFIVVSGTVGEDAAVQAMKNGANDYVLKGSLARLGPAVERELREAAIRADRRRMHEQLVIADRMASVGMLAAAVAHEINNPLAAVIGNLELLAEGLRELGGELQIHERLKPLFEELHDVRSGAERVRQISRDLRIFSRTSDAETRVPVELKPILESSLRMAQNEIRHRACLITDYGSDVPRVWANEGRLGQVFLNLVVNAAQAIREGDAKHNSIRVSTGVDASGNAKVEISDTGCGISSENLQRIFVPFFTTKPVEVGTGLGLAVCRTIVSSLGGEIQVESELGKGTTFRVLLPPAVESVASAPPVVAEVPAVRRGRVLVVDDEPAIIRTVQKMLQPEHDVISSVGGAHALQRILSGERFDVILCDVMMPDMTGMELYEQLARVAPDQAGDVVFLTGGAFTAAARAFLERVPNQRLEKPFDWQQLRAFVNERIR